MLLSLLEHSVIQGKDFVTDVNLKFIQVDTVTNTIELSGEAVNDNDSSVTIRIQASQMEVIK